MRKNEIKIDKLSSLKSSIIILLLFQNFIGFGQIFSTAELKKEVLEIINPIHAKIISKNDTTIVFKNEVMGTKEILRSLKLISIDTIKIDTTIIYQQGRFNRKFSTLPRYETRKVKFRTKNKREHIEERQFLKEKSKRLKIEKWDPEYNRDTFKVISKYEIERTVNIPEQYSWSLDTIWIPEKEQILSLKRLAEYEIVEEIIEIAPTTNRWIRETHKRHTHDCCQYRIDEECMGSWALEEIPAKFIRIKKIMMNTNTGGRGAIPQKIKYEVIPRKTLLVPASIKVEKIPSVFEQKIKRGSPINARETQKETLEIGKEF